MRGVLFDKDGTLLDFEATWAPLYRDLTLDLVGGDPAAAENLLLAGGLDPETRRMRAGSVLGAGTTADIVSLWFPDLSGDDFAAMAAHIDGTFHAHGARGSVAVDGVLGALQALAAMDIAMGVATNDATVAARGAIASLGLDRYLPHIFGYDSVARPKPAPDIVFAFADAVGLAPREIAVVGDNRVDLEMARSAGAVAVGVLTGNAAATDLEPLADMILPSVRELPGWLAERNAAGR